MISPAVLFEVEKFLGKDLVPESARSVSGGCIHDSQLIDFANGELLFLKQNRAEAKDLFDAEKASLEVLKATQAIYVPTPYLTGTVGDQSFFAMEGLTLTSHGASESQAKMGTQLAALHGTLSPNGQFGAPFDNFIGATPQSNRRHAIWFDFFVVSFVLCFLFIFFCGGAAAT